jgi:hypothetical protein
MTLEGVGDEGDKDPRGVGDGVGDREDDCGVGPADVVVVLVEARPVHEVARRHRARHRRRERGGVQRGDEEGRREQALPSRGR